MQLYKNRPNWTLIVRRIALFTLNKMRWLAAFFFSLVALDHGSWAFKCNSNVDINITLIARSFQKDIATYRVPTVEYNDLTTPQFRDMYTYALMFWSINLVENLRNQAEHRGDELARDIRKATDTLYEAIRSLAPEYEAPSCLEGVFRHVVDQMNIFLELEPEKTEYQRPEPVHFPVQPIEVEDRTTPRTRWEIFNNFVATGDEISRHGYAYLTSVYLRAWSYVRQYYETLRTQIYRKILNGPVLNAYKTAVDEVYEQSDLIQSNVSPKTWKSFCLAADQIIAVSEHCNYFEDD